MNVFARFDSVSCETADNKWRNVTGPTMAGGYATSAPGVVAEPGVGRAARVKAS